ncbi:toprim domain-containing protein [Salibacterium aidingense]|uniref:toprim domain-containing protein n=1 Tax=Salibacterium aidingense TaxID=384933 RepID=UPI003BE0A503
MTDTLTQHIDITEELAAFSWRAARWQAEKLIAASPFRDDTHPSFYVYLEDTPTAAAGSWGDSGTGERGGFVRLLAGLRGETAEETVEYLREKYGIYADQPRETFTIQSIGKARARAAEKSRVRTMTPPQGVTPDYVIQRGISPEICAQAGVVQAGNAIALPWRDRKRRVRAVKYRSIAGKSFWYAAGGENVRDLVYGIDAIGPGEVAVVESELDALYLRTADVQAVALGGAEQVNARKAELIAASPASGVVIMADHDSAGQRMKRALIRQMRDFPGLPVKVAGYPARYKDANEVADLAAIRTYITNAKYVRKMAKIG